VTRMRNLLAAGLAIGLVAVATAALSASLSLSDPWDEPLPTAGKLDGLDLVASKVVGRTLIPGSELSLPFDRGSFAVSSGCNATSGGYEVRDDRLRLIGAMQTMMGCGTEAEAQDDWVVDAISGAVVSQSAAQVTLRSGDIVLTFIPAMDR
jgi:heat shock protein HslJ